LFQEDLLWTMCWFPMNHSLSKEQEGEDWESVLLNLTWPRPTTVSSGSNYAPSCSSSVSEKCGIFNHEMC
jgi:hypothetical protein